MSVTRIACYFVEIQGQGLISGYIFVVRFLGQSNFLDTVKISTLSIDSFPRPSEWQCQPLIDREPQQNFTEHLFV